MAAFPTLNFTVDADKWGPSSLPEKFSDIPFAPFNKSEKIGRAADWSAPAYPNRYQGGRGHQGGQTGPFSYQHREDEDSFLIVDNRAVQKPKSFAPRNRFGGRIDRFNRRELERWGGEKRDKDPNAQVNQRQQMPKTGFAKRSGPGGWGRGGGAWQNRRWDSDQNKQANKDASLDVPSSWTVCESSQFSSLQKLTANPPEGRILREVGAVNFCDKQFDRITTKLDKRLGSLEGTVHERTTASEDPIMQQLAEEGAGNVFATDIVLATLMAAPRSVESWDIIVTKKGDQIFLDKRESSSIDILTVGETANEPPTDEKEGVNSASSLARESTLINQTFHSQFANSSQGVHEFAEPSPFKDQPHTPPVAYRYRAFDLDEDTVVVCRCEIDGATQGKNGTNFLSIKALNEWDAKTTGVNWRKQLDMQRGAVLATEIRNNSFKLARWGVCSLLAGVDQIKIGYVSRLSPKDNQHHTVLGTQNYKPNELAAQMALNIKNVWGILDYYVSQIRDQEDGKYVLLKDPNKAVLRLHAVAKGEESRVQ